MSEADGSVPLRNFGSGRKRSVDKMPETVGNVDVVDGSRKRSEASPALPRQTKVCVCVCVFLQLLVRVTLEIMIYFRGRGLSTHNANLSGQNAYISAHNAEFKWTVLGGSGSGYLCMPMALWNLFSGSGSL